MEEQTESLTEKKKRKRILSIDERIEKNTKDLINLFQEIKHSLNRHTNFLQKITKVNESAEDTLLNVLLAIKQNEFLQAWYSAQKGYPEMHVIGSHPAASINDTIIKPEEKEC